jgi:hypothetical protein
LLVTLPLVAFVLLLGLVVALYLVVFVFKVFQPILNRLQRRLDRRFLVVLPVGLLVPTRKGG